MNFKELRNRIQVLKNTIPNLPSSRPVVLANTSVQTAMMWSGNILKALSGGETPYANDGKRTKVTDIEPMFEKTDNSFKLSGNDVADIDLLRQEISKEIASIEDFMLQPGSIEEDLSDRGEMQFMIAVGSVMQYLTETRMWLGMQLGAIRDAAK